MPSQNTFNLEFRKIKLFEVFVYMPQSLSNILIHLIWSTKERHPWFSADIKHEIHSYLAGVVLHCNCKIYRVGGVADHVHLAVRLSRTLSVANLVKEVKTASSRWLKMQDTRFAKFSWQQGYGAFSIGMSQKASLIHYIDTQEEHHSIRTFQDEYRDFLNKYAISYDERYVWD